MKELKTRDTVKDFRTLDRTSNVADRMGNAYVRTKDRAEQTQQTNADSPDGNAGDRATECTQDLTYEVGNELWHQGKHLAEKTKELSKGNDTRESIQQKEKTPSGQQKPASPKASTSPHGMNTSERVTPNYSANERSVARESIRWRTERTISDYTGKELRHGVKTVERGMNQSVRTSEKTIRKSARESIKTLECSVKTAEKISRTAIKTTRNTAKTAAKTAQVSAKTAQRAAQVVKVSAKATAKTLVKATTAITKAIVAAVKSLIAAIVAGGWVAVIIIVVILLAAYILSSVFGIFASEEGYDGAPSMPDVVNQINADFSAKIDSIIESNPHDRLIIDNAGSASMVSNWNEVLAIFAVYVATDPENPTFVATLDDAKIDKLKTVFWEMNSISYSVDELNAGTDEETDKPVTETVLTISVRYKTVEDMILFFGFNPGRASQVRELLQPEYAELFLRLTGSYQEITLTAVEIAAIMETLPDDLSEARKDVVLTAYSLLGKVKYFWGGKSLVFGWDSRWGTPMKVTANDNPSTGTVRLFGLDCSGLVDWVFYNALDEYIVGHGGGAIAQYRYCDAISWSSAQPGDLVFYPECEHVGIVVKNDAGSLSIIHCASGYDNVVMTQHTQGYGFAFVGRPQIYDK